MAMISVPIDVGFSWREADGFLKHHWHLFTAVLKFFYFYCHDECFIFVMSDNRRLRLFRFDHCVHLNMSWLTFRRPA